MILTHLEDLMNDIGRAASGDANTEASSLIRLMRQPEMHSHRMSAFQPVKSANSTESEQE